MLFQLKTSPLIDDLKETP